MQKQPILYGTIGLLAGSLLTLIVATTSVNANNNSMMRMMGMHTNNSSIGMMKDDSMGMDQMTASLKGKTGEDFDKAFLSEMIVHHQGAIEMASLANQNAKHDEIKKLSENIVTAQTNEIKEMKQWQKDWGYQTEDNTMGGMHSGH